MTPHRRLEALDARLAPYEEPRFVAGQLDLLVEEIERFAIEIMHSPTAPNAAVYAREICINCRVARERLAEFRRRSQQYEAEGR